MYHYIQILLYLILFFVIPLKNINAATTAGAKFLNIPINAYQQSMGLTASAGGTDSMNYNPAGMSQQNKISQRYAEVATTYSKLASDLFFTHFSGFSKLPRNLGMLGGYISYLDYGFIENFDAKGKLLNPIVAYDIEVATSYSYEIINNLYIGANIKFVHEKIDIYSAYAAVFDIGTKWNANIFGSDLWLSFAVNNVGTPLKFDKENTQLPSRIHFAASYNLIKGLPKWLILKFEPSTAYYFENYFIWGMAIEASFKVIRELNIYTQSRYGSENNYKGLSFGVGGSYSYREYSFHLATGIKPITPFGVEYILSLKLTYAFGLLKLSQVKPIDFEQDENQNKNWEKQKNNNEIKTLLPDNDLPDDLK